MFLSQLQRFALAAAVVSCLTAGVALADKPQTKPAKADDQPASQQEERSFWMQKKLEHTQEILNGLVTEDFALIRKNAIALKGLNRLEYFVRREPEAYRTQLKLFQFSVEELERLATEKNLDGASLAFTQMTLSCVKCHQQLRKE